MSLKARRRRLIALGVAALAAVGLVATVDQLNRLDEAPLSADAPPPGMPPADLVARGAYLARAGNCAACHTERGGTPYAGGRALPTPFGTVYSSNLTPDDDTGLGRWSADAFWRALHNGRSRDGRLLYPVFPYPNYTQVTRADSDALYAYLRSLAPARAPNRAHELAFPIGTQPALAVWRALYFRPGVHRDEPGRTADWNRGAYLVRGLGHCAACHEARNLLGASQGVELAGGLMPLQNWYAPSLRDPREAGVADWPEHDIVALLRTGLAPRGGVLGPMADVVYRSTQYLSEPDLRAIAVFLKSLPPPPRSADAPPDAPTDAPTDAPPPSVLRQGQALYEHHCIACHGEQGEGVPGVYPALAGNRAVRMHEPANVIRVIAKGGFLPATQGNPRPFGMPPFAHLLSDAEIAAVASYVRGSWGNQAGLVEPQTVSRLRAGSED